MINDLSKQLVGRLGTVLFECRHIDVIDKNDHFATCRGTDEILFLLLEFIFVHEQIL